VRKQTLGKLDNVLFLKAEATEFLDALPATVALRKIFILYPDPWPKKKHHKNRFINAENLARLAAHAAPGTRLHFRTDNADYFAWTGEHLAAHPGWRVEPAATWPFEQKTFFEERMKERRDVFADRRG
jgi:tRNA (guanine-N7-)-methyltransferase